MSLMCTPLSCGTVLCRRISMASQTHLVCQCGIDVMRLLSSQFILCCCACFVMADLSPSPSRWQALCSLILVLNHFVFPDVDFVLVFPVFVCVE